MRHKKDGFGAKGKITALDYISGHELLFSRHPRLCPRSFDHVRRIAWTSRYEESLLILNVLHQKERKAQIPRAMLAPLHLLPKTKAEHAPLSKQRAGTSSTAIRNDVPANALCTLA